MPADNIPLSAAEARTLFAPYVQASALILAVSGGPDSTALMWLAARWRRGLRKGPRLVVVTVDHGLRRESAAEARAVKALASTLDITHVTKRWVGKKPSTGVPAAARAARYRLLRDAARRERASHILTAHTLDDQAETILMRMARGSGLTGLGGMAQHAPLDGSILARPLLGIPKTRLLATLRAAKIAFATDPGNTDPAYLRPRLRELLPRLAAEGLDAYGFARLATRLARADAALARATDEAEQMLGRVRDGIDAARFAACPSEIQIRLLQRWIDRAGAEGPAELRKIEALQEAIAAEPRAGLRRTLAGALVSLGNGRLSISAAPPRRSLVR